MPTKDELQAENTALKAQLAAAGRTPRVQGPQHLFLSEGDRQELERTGYLNVGSRRLNREQVLAELGPDQQGVEIGEPTAEVTAPPVPAPTNIRGFDFVYPSVSRGLIDPAVAGTPGINGPAAPAGTGPVVDVGDVEPEAE